VCLIAAGLGTWQQPLHHKWRHIFFFLQHCMNNEQLYTILQICTVTLFWLQSEHWKCNYFYNTVHAMAMLPSFYKDSVTFCSLSVECVNLVLYVFGVFLTGALLMLINFLASLCLVSPCGDQGKE